MVGCLLGLLCAISGVLVGGGGHGWVSAWPFGMVSLFLFPAAFIRLACFRSTSLSTSVLLFAVAALLDAALYMSSMSEGTYYFLRVKSLATQWLILWGTWQFVIVFTLALSLFFRPRRSI